MKLGGLTPIFADITPDTLCLDPKSVQEAITPRTVAICGVHLYGTPCDIDALESIANRNHLKLFFDSAHGLGSTHKGKPVGRSGMAEGFSTSVTKIFTTLGEGGFISTNDDAFARRIKMARNWGHDGNYNSKFASIVSKLPEIGAAAGLLALPRLEQNVKNRNKLVKLAQNCMSEIPGITFPKIRDSDTSGYKDFPILIDEKNFGVHRDIVATALKAEGIDTRPYYSPPAHKMKAYENMKIRVSLQVTERMAETVLCLPIFNEMTDETMERLCCAVISIHKSASSLRKP